MYGCETGPTGLTRMYPPVMLGPGGDSRRDIWPVPYFTRYEKIALAGIALAIGLAILLQIADCGLRIEKQNNPREGEEPSRLAAAMTGSPDEGALAQTWSGDATALTRPVSSQSSILNPQSSIEMTEADLGSGKGGISPRSARALTRPPTRSEKRPEYPSGLAVASRNTGRPDTVTSEDLDYFWWRESRRGKDLRWKIRGPAGEEGQYRITPPFTVEVERISGYHIDVFDNDSCRKGIVIWMNYWAPRVEAQTRDELYNLYRRGAAGYRKWKRGVQRW